MRQHLPGGRTFGPAFLSCVLFGFFAAGSIAPAAAQISENVLFAGNVDDHTEYSDIWGYTDEFGAEYAILGEIDGTAIINVTDPATAYETGFIQGVSSIWRDMKTYGDYAYVVTEGGGGMHIIDLTDPENPVLAATYTGFDSAHNIYIEEAAGRAYACGTDIANGGIHIMDLTVDPTAPVALGNWSTTFVHDLYVRNGIAYLAEINEPSFTIVDLNVPTAPVVLGGPVTYPGAFTHNTWITDDAQVLLTTDELLGGKVRLWDISDLGTITQIGEYQAPETNSIVHNVTVKGSLAIVSYYSEGLRIADISDPTTPIEVGFYDTFTGASGGFDGAWGVYPYLPSGRVLISDIQTGLWILEPTNTYGLLRGTVREAGVGTPVAGANVQLVEPGKTTTSGASGNYGLAAASGTYTLQVSLEGFTTLTQSVTIAQGSTAMLDVDLQRLPSSPLTGTIRGTDDGISEQPLGNAVVELVGTGFRAVTGNDGQYGFPAIPHGSYTLRVTRPAYGRAEHALEVVPGPVAHDVLLQRSPFFDDATTDQGWMLGQPFDTASTGLWIRAAVVPSGGGAVQPAVDASPDDTSNFCFVTGNAASPSSGIGAEDVDGGQTTLVSPSLDLSAMGDPHLAYSRWYVNSAGSNPGQDVFTVEISNDDGSTWTLVEQLGNDATPWTRVVWRVSDFVTPSTTVRLRFIASDLGGGSVVEALVDDLEFFDPAPVATAAPGPLSARRSAVRSIAPNPFNPRTTIEFEVARSGPVTLDLLDLRGRHVRTLVNERVDEGVHAMVWDGMDDQHHAVGSGVYFVRLVTRDARSVRKLVLVR